MAKDKRVERAFHEVYKKVPSTVKKAGLKGEARRKQMVAVALSKARQAGAKIPEKGSMQAGGIAPIDAPYELHRGEMIKKQGQVPGMPTERKFPTGFGKLAPAPIMDKGGVVPKTGIYNLEVGEKVIPVDETPAEEQAELLEQSGNTGSGSEGYFPENGSEISECQAAHIEKNPYYAQTSTRERRAEFQKKNLSSHPMTYDREIGYASPATHVKSVSPVQEEIRPKGKYSEEIEGLPNIRKPEILEPKMGSGAAGMDVEKLRNMVYPVSVLPSSERDEEMEKGLLKKI